MTRLRLGVLAALPVVLALCGARAEAKAPRCEGGSVSVGTPEKGRLHCGRRIAPRGKHHLMQPFTVEQDYLYGTDELVEGVLWIAEAVVKARLQPRLVVGNLSQEGGGEMPMSRSHESGRDFDLPLLHMTPRGGPIWGVYHRFDARGRSLKDETRVRFDAGRCWKMIAIVLRCPTFEVRLIVIAPPLKKLMMDWARANKVDAAEVALLDRKLVKPFAGVKAHDNHFHVRVECSTSDQAKGCANVKGG